MAVKPTNMVVGDPDPDVTRVSFVWSGSVDDTDHDLAFTALSQHLHGPGTTAKDGPGP